MNAVEQSGGPGIHSFALLMMLAVVLGGVYLNRRLLMLITQRLGQTNRALGRHAVKHLRRPLKLFVPIALVHVVLPLFGLSAELSGPLQHVLLLGLIASLAWVAMGVAGLWREVVLGNHDMEQPNNLEARRALTQVNFFYRFVLGLIVFIAIAAALMTFSQIRNFGLSLLASAGVAGIIIGFAAQRSIATILAGIQIAITQPIRIDDVVIVEGEWGWIEEITLTYVVVKIWDERRLIVPIQYFIEKPFQNWTRTSAELLGAVYIYADYTLPVGALREELNHILASTPLWDGRVGCLQVTSAKENALELRALMSACDSPKAWDLRCLVRERLVQYIRDNHPQCLPHMRAKLEKEA